MIWSMHNIQNDFKRRVKLIFAVVFSVEITLSGSHSRNSFEFNHWLTGFLNYALFCLSFCLRLNLKPVNYLTTSRSSMAKCQGSIFILFWQCQRPHTAKNNKIIQILNVLFINLMFKVCCLGQIRLRFRVCFRLQQFSSFPCTFDRCLEPKTLYCMSNN